MSAQQEAVQREASAAAAVVVARLSGITVTPEDYGAWEVAAERIVTAALVKARADALAEVAACLRFMPEGAVPRG